MNIKEVVKQNPEGFSINIKSLELEQRNNGFIVGITNNKTTIDNVESEFIHLLKVANKLSFNEEDIFIGGWKDDDGFCLDVSLWIRNISIAVQFGKLFNQEAVWGCIRKENIYLEDL